MAALLSKLATNPEMQKIAASAAGNIVDSVADDTKKGTIAELPVKPIETTTVKPIETTTVKPAEISAATISAKSDDIFIQIGEKLCSSIQEIVESKQYTIIDNINKTITRHLESDSVKDVISKKIEETLNSLPTNKEELIKNVNERIKETVNAEIERTFTNPDTFEKIKDKLKSITDTPTKTTETNNPQITGGTRKYKPNKSNRNKLNKKKKSLKRKQ
jgi:hypothetical protein